MIAATAAGAALVVVTGIDLLLALLHPTRTGPVSRSVMAATWRGVRAAGSRSRSRAGSLINYAGTLVMLAQITTWVLGMWIGFAMIHAGHLDQMAYTTPAGPAGVRDALYLSGAALTTVGFGDLVAATDPMRLVAVAEAATGLAVFAAAVTYVLSVYPLASEIRVAARLLATVHDDHSAAELIVHGGPSRLEGIQRDLIQIDESTQRFPVLYYFHSEEPTASLATAVRATSLVVLQLRFGLDDQAMPHARWHGEVLGSTLTSVIEHFEDQFFSLPFPPAPDLPHHDVELRIAHLRTAAEQVTGAATALDFDRKEAAGLLARCNAFLAELQRRHGYLHQPL